MGKYPTQLGNNMNHRVCGGSEIVSVQILRSNLSLTESVWLRLLLMFALMTMRLEWPLNCFGVALARRLCRLATS